MIKGTELFYISWQPGLKCNTHTFDLKYYFVCDSSKVGMFQLFQYIALQPLFFVSEARKDKKKKRKD